jgi:uncharacterized membrane protein
MNTGGSGRAVLPENVACTLCYLLFGITGIVFLALGPYNRSRNVRFHALQSLLFTAGFTTVWAVIGAIAAMLIKVPVLGWAFPILLFVTFLGFLLCWLMLMYKAYRNERFRLPLIGPFAEKQA